MGDDGARVPHGRALTRAEVDLLVRESLRRERHGRSPDEAHLEAQLAARADALRRTSGRAGEARGRGATSRTMLTAVVVLGVVLAAIVFGRHLLLPGPVDTVATEPHVYDDGHYAFLRKQPDGRDLPVGYNPCKRIPVKINYAGATPDIRARVDEAITEINAASGLRLAYAGATGLRRPDSGQSGGIVVSFANVGTDAYLGGAVIGFGGSSSYLTATAGSTTYFLGGGLTLDTDQFNPASRSVQRAVLLHEIGHTLGLGHVRGSTEIMNPSVNAASHFQHGDLTGLAILGALPCR